MRRMAVAFAMAVGTAFAQDTKLSDKEIAAWDSEQQELVECTAYKHFAKTCAPGIENAGENDLKLLDRAMAVDTELALAIGSKIGMPQDARLSRIKTAMENQATTTQGKCIHHPSWEAKYWARCAWLAQTPLGVFQEHMGTRPPFPIPPSFLSSKEK